MTYTGSWLFKWRILGIIALAAMVGLWFVHTPRLVFSDKAGYYTVAFFLMWLIRCAWLGLFVLNVFRTYRMSFYFITDAEGGITIRNALWLVPIARFNAGETERADFKKTGVFHYKLQITGNGDKTRWYGNDSLKVHQWQALVDDLKAPTIVVEVENKTE